MLKSDSGNCDSANSNSSKGITKLKKNSFVVNLSFIMLFDY